MAIELDEKKYLVTVLDDEAHVGEYLEAALGSAFKITPYIDGRTGLLGIYEAIQRGEKPDLIVIDGNMPGLGGREVIMALRILPEVNAIPIIALSSTIRESELRGARKVQKMHINELPIIIPKMIGKE